MNVKTQQKMTGNNDTENWDLVISSRQNAFSLNLKELWLYRDLLFIFVKRDLTAQYKQTIMGPLWHLISPLLTALTFAFIFGSVVRVPTEGTPPVLFYMAGITLWNFFSQTLTQAGATFTTNARMFSKVYFPRMISPLSMVISGMIRFGIQLLLLLAMMCFYCESGLWEKMSWTNLVLLPLIAVLTAAMGLGGGIILTSVGVKYRDVSFLAGFGVNLLMYATPVLYPLSAVPEKYRMILEWNPISPLMELMRLAVTGMGTVSFYSVGYSFLCSVFLLLAGILVFNRAERTAIDLV